LHVTVWSPPGPCQPAGAAVVLVHGYAEHAGRYGQVGAALAASGATAWAMDLRGHGRSEGRRANIESLSGAWRTWTCW
jgi:alpha-beta hydrolase superfamily lysophospholipase